MSIVRIKHVSLKFVPLTDEVKDIILNMRDGFVYVLAREKVEDGRRFIDAVWRQPMTEEDTEELREEVEDFTHIALFTIPAALPYNVFPAFVETDEQQADKLLRKAKRLTAPKKGGNQ